MIIQSSKAAKEIIRRGETKKVAGWLVQKFLKSKKVETNIIRRRCIMSSQVLGEMSLIYQSLPENNPQVQSEKGSGMLDALEGSNYLSNFDCVLYNEPTLTNKLDFISFFKLLVQNVLPVLRMRKHYRLCLTHFTNREYIKAAKDLKNIYDDFSFNQIYLLVYMYDKKRNVTKKLDETLSDKLMFLKCILVAWYLLAWLFCTYYLLV